MGQNTSIYGKEKPKKYPIKTTSTLAWILAKVKQNKQVIVAPTPPIKFQYCQPRRKSKKTQNLKNFDGKTWKNNDRIINNFRHDYHQGGRISPDADYHSFYGNSGMFKTTKVTKIQKPMVNNQNQKNNLTQRPYLGSKNDQKPHLSSKNDQNKPYLSSKMDQNRTFSSKNNQNKPYLSKTTDQNKTISSKNDQNKPYLSKKTHRCQHQNSSKRHCKDFNKKLPKKSLENKENLYKSFDQDSIQDIYNFEWPPSFKTDPKNSPVCSEKIIYSDNYSINDLELLKNLKTQKNSLENYSIKSSKNSGTFNNYYYYEKVPSNEIYDQRIISELYNYQKNYHGSKIYHENDTNNHENPSLEVFNQKNRTKQKIYYEDEQTNSILEPLNSYYQQKLEILYKREKENGELYLGAKEKPWCLKERTLSEPSLRKHHRSRSRESKFGYDIADINDFLTEASLKNPANIPIVLTRSSTLYEVRSHINQGRIHLALGTVVNGIFKKGEWLYVQTPHAQEGYVSYGACIPLGIVPKDAEKTPLRCWESSTDIFPMPNGNMTDSEKLCTRSEYGGSRKRLTKRRGHRRNAASECGESNVDSLYLKAVSARIRENQKCESERQILLVIDSDYSSTKQNTLKVSAGDVVALIGSPDSDWFWVKAKDGTQGFIPASIVGNGHY